MKIYVAGNYTEDKLKCRYLMRTLEEAGHEITCDWTSPEFDDAPHLTCCMTDIAGIKTADCLIFYAVFDRKYRGSFVEMGMALALNKPVFILGDAIDTCIFTAHPNIKKFSKLSEVLSHLRG